MVLPEFDSPDPTSALRLRYNAREKGYEMEFEDSLINECFPCCGPVVNGQCQECGTHYQFTDTFSTDDVDIFS